MIKEVGKQLQKARTEQEISLEAVSEELHIRVRYLKALEDGDPSILPSPVQVRGFIRLYADFLKLDPERLLDELEQSSGAEKVEEEPPVPQVEPEPEDDSTKVVAEIFAEIGFTIKQRRDLLGLSLGDVEEHTHIPAHYIEYLESGRFDRFPSPVQARGMLGNYVNFLELDANSVLLRYAEALQTGLAARQGRALPDKETNDVETETATPSKPKIGFPLWLRSVISADTLLIGTVGIIVIGITIWGIGRITRTISETVPQPTAPSLADVLAPSATPQPSPTGTLLVTPTLQLLDIGDEEAVEATSIPTIPVTGGNISLYIITRQRTYLRVTVDGTVAYDGRAARGINLTFTGSQTVEVLTGNAAALQIFYNEQDMGSLGILGEVIDIVFTRDGVLLPTPTPTPTLSPEELLTITPTPGSEPDVPEQVDTPIP